MSEQPEQPTVWVHTHPRPNGKGYVVTIDADEDTSKTLTPDKALKHAYGVLTVAHRAVYDAALFKQLTTLGIDQEYAGQMVMDMRKDRADVPARDLEPLWLEPGVSAFTGEPFIAIEIKGQRVGQWTFADAERHALGVLGSVAVADLDSSYLAALTGTVGLDEDRAMRVVSDIGRFRPEGAR